jgi:hypothetical protein
VISLRTAQSTSAANEIGPAASSARPRRSASSGSSRSRERAWLSGFEPEIVGSCGTTVRPRLGSIKQIGALGRPNSRQKLNSAASSGSRIPSRWRGPSMPRAVHPGSCTRIPPVVRSGPCRARRLGPHRTPSREADGRCRRHASSVRAEVDEAPSAGTGNRKSVSRASDDLAQTARFDLVDEAANRILMRDEWARLDPLDRLAHVRLEIVEGLGRPGGL